MIVKKWSIWRANLDPVIGSEQGKSRPVLIISEDERVIKHRQYYSNNFQKT
jgi:mRNA-degrading endonuclease toxin of MazEF toxin-antitoxin module